MFRRSVRLQETGYYTEEGSPWISYKERLFRVFQRRRAFDRGDQKHSANQSESANEHDFIHLDDHQDASHSQDTISDEKSETLSNHSWTAGPQAAFTTTSTTRTQTFSPKRKNVRTTRSSTLNIVSHLLLLSLVCGFIHAYVQMRELQQEVQSLRRRIDTAFPSSDTLPNFALKSQGATVQAGLSSDTSWSHSMWILDRLLYWWHTANKQAKVIRGDSSLHPGDCWPLSGPRGHLFITLSHPASITHVTLGHVTKSQSPSGFIESAPREFSVYGMKTTDDEGTYLGTSVYDEDGSAFQTFEVTNPNETVFRHVKLQINTNWGNSDGTCLYRFRVHGKLPN